VAEILASAEAPVPIAGGIGQPLATAA
jgi:hypothetical protein